MIVIANLLFNALPSYSQETKVQSQSSGRDLALSCSLTESDVLWKGFEKLPIACAVTNQLSEPIIFLRLNNDSYVDFVLNAILRDHKGEELLPNGLVRVPPTAPSAKDFVILSSGETYTFDLNTAGIGLRYNFFNLKAIRYTLDVKFKAVGGISHRTVTGNCTIDFEVRDIRDFVVSQVSELPRHEKPQDPNLKMIGKVAIVQRSAGKFWLAYWTESGRQGKMALSGMRWLGPIQKDEAFKAWITEEDDVHVTFKNAEGKQQHALIKNFSGETKFIEEG